MQSPNPRRFALSDIHGCRRTFAYMVEEVLKLNTTDTLYLLGDYIDRGPDSKGVIDYIWQLQATGHNVVCLAGNHETMLLAARIDPYSSDNRLWENNGGRETLLSFGVERADEIDHRYTDFFYQLSLYVELDDYVLVHAGFDLSNPEASPFDNRHAMLWMRPKNWYEYLAQQRPFGDKIVIHGHTPQEHTDILDSLDCRRFPAINIDAACAYQGKLCAFDLDRREVRFHDNIDIL
jgi:serine/threonine protein phosphatase 1